jgi:MFS family permease
MIVGLYFEPALANYIKDKFDIGTKINGFAFGLLPLSYAVMCIFLGYFTDRFPRRVVTLWGFLICVIGNIFVGPSKLLHLPESLTLVILGLFINGVGIAFIFVPLLVELMHIVSHKEKINSGNTQFNDKASGIFNFSFALGTILSPNLGGTLSDEIGFRYAADTMVIFSLVMACIWALTNVGITKVCDLTKDTPMYGEEAPTDGK